MGIPFTDAVVVWGAFVLMNVAAFLIMLWDKRQSRRPGAERLSEGLLFFMAASFGSVGVLLGMIVSRHKTRKWYFLIGIPLLIMENLATLSLIALIVGQQ